MADDDVWWTVTVENDGGTEHVEYRTLADSWERALADVSALFLPSGEE